ncbi:class I SAM-dependent methyltransferase [Alcanivorax sp. S6407]|uniref:DUF938 domain-containing protein n=1 Tax=Alcanivorax sp. S6407 TaxID=2926424 RepID=UPI001FF5B1CF|nr:DUF938 domain-containing protein [Alcanivorax sp. S6407]MCK0153225.1 class I SAM-dependent methyltransferase [Alcanivorax sp. S6407]
MISERPFSQACENNKGPILSVLREHCQAPGTLLEIGAGTGQHAAWLSGQLPHLTWQPSDVAENLPVVRQWLEEPDSKALAPIVLDVGRTWPDQRFDYLYTANTFHIMSRELVTSCIEEGCRHLTPNGRFLIYGPFRINGRYTSDSNAAFESWLKDIDPLRGIRDKEWIEEEFARHGRRMIGEYDLPANNMMLVFE